MPKPPKEHLDYPEELRAKFREFNARRARVPGVCAWCAAAIPPSYATRRYCSNACRQRQKRAKAKAQQHDQDQATPER